MKWISLLRLRMLAVLILVGVGCHSASLKNNAMSGSALVTQTSWVKDYKQARAARESDPVLACRLFTELAEQEKFPAREMAALRRREVCDEMMSQAFDRAAIPAWMQDIALDIALKQVAKSGDKVAEMELALEKSKQNLIQSEKIKWMEVAISRAEELSQLDRADEFKQRLYSIAPRLNPNPKAREFLDVANDLRRARQFTKAREYYEKVIRSAHYGLAEKISAHKGIRLSFKNARQMDAHIDSAQDLVAWLSKMRRANPRSQPLRQAQYDAEMFYGRALWTAHRRAEAGAVFDGLEKRMKGKVPLGELYWLKARFIEEEKNYDGVSHYLDLAVKERIRDSDLRDKIFWYSAWNERRRNNMPRAAELLSELSVQSQSEFTRLRALFWLGKTYEELRDEENAKGTFERLVDMDPMGYYGLLAHRHLGLSITFKQTQSDEIPRADIPLDLVMAEWLAAIEEKEALTALLDQAARAYRKQDVQTDEGWFALFQYYAKGGLYMKLYESLGSLPPERRKGVLERHPDLLFPQPWLNEVKTAALQFGVEEELIYAIMRQESAFDTRARSFADAFGLMQVLPEVAEAIGQQHKIPYEGMDNLYDPKTNVMIGAAHIRDLMARHRGQFILAVASYNASEKAIRNWMRTRFRGDSLEFIEEIPYEETRTYVRLVMRNMIFYSLLKSKNASIEFPSWVLKLEDAS